MYTGGAGTVIPYTRYGLSHHSHVSLDHCGVYGRVFSLRGLGTIVPVSTIITILSTRPPPHRVIELQLRGEDEASRKVDKDEAGGRKMAVVSLQKVSIVFHLI